MALVKDEILVPTKGAPELAFTMVPLATLQDYSQCRHLGALLQAISIGALQVCSHGALPQGTSQYLSTVFSLALPALDSGALKQPGSSYVLAKCIITMEGVTREGVNVKGVIV